MGQIATTALVARINLAPPASPGAPPAALQPTNPLAQKWAAAQRAVTSAGRSVTATLTRAAAAPSGGSGAATPTVNQGPAIGAGGPAPTGTNPAAVIAGLSPTVRTALKIVPFVVAAYFWRKGDRTIAGVAAGAGALAVWRL